MGEKLDTREGIGHRERLREKYLNLGVEGFHFDYEKLEFLLIHVVPRQDVKPIARELIKKFGDIENVLKADYRELQLVKGIGERGALFLRFIGDLHKTIFLEKIKNEKSSERKAILSKADIICYLKNEIGFLDRENFVVLFLDSSNRVIDTPDLRSGTIFEGTLDRSAIYPREILKRITEQHRVIDEELEAKITLKFQEEGTVSQITAKKIMEKAYKNRAKSVIFAHNHPSGNLRPSRSDIEITREMKEILKQAEVRLLDHLIISRDSYFSFLEEGLIEH